MHPYKHVIAPQTTAVGWKELSPTVTRDEKYRCRRISRRRCEMRQCKGKRISAQFILMFHSKEPSHLKNMSRVASAQCASRTKLDLSLNEHQHLQRSLHEPCNGTRNLYDPTQDLTEDTLLQQETTSDRCWVSHSTLRQLLRFLQLGIVHRSWFLWLWFHW